MSAQAGIYEPVQEPVVRVTARVVRFLTITRGATVCLESRTAAVEDFVSNGGGDRERHGAARGRLGDGL